jgi:hypothetical protein
MARKRRIYLSSTFIDLATFRAAVREAVEPAGYDFESMEKYPAFEERPLDKCLADVSACDYYVLLIARRYGFIPSDKNPGRRSITHLEYLRAREKRKPCFIFLLDPTASWSSTLSDPDYDTSGSPFREFLSTLMLQHGIAYFKTPADLSTKVLQALHAYEKGPVERNWVSLIRWLRETAPQIVIVTMVTDIALAGFVRVTLPFVSLSFGDMCMLFIPVALMIGVAVTHGAIWWLNRRRLREVKS